MGYLTLPFHITWNIVPVAVSVSSANTLIAAGVLDLCCNENNHIHKVMIMETSQFGLTQIQKLLG